MAKKTLQIKGLRQRWMLNTIMPVLVLVILAVCLFSASITSYYYTRMESTLKAQARSDAESFNSYSMDSYGEYYQAANLLVENFADKDVLELQFINTSGRIQLSSYGLTTGNSPGTSDITDAMETGEVQSFRGSDPQTGENILAVSSPLIFNGKVVGVMRYVTSLQAVNRQIWISVLVVCLLAVLCISLVFFANLLFINNVVEPVAEVSQAAKRISAGSYGIQVENKYDDELGELVDNINDMSLKISQSEKMKSEFISSVSHELRTPLTAINGWGETLLEDAGSEDPEQLRRGISIILKESRRLTNMVEELLEFSKMEDGRFTLRMEPAVELQAEFEDAIYTYRELFRQEGIELHYAAPDEDLPSIPGDPERLKQVFCNVLDNAAKHGGSGKRIDTAISREGDFLVLRIRDYGPGIPEAELPFVKQKFYKGSSKARGSGIGLAVCDEIVRLHNGIFQIDNAEGGGTVVTIRLPLAD